MKRQTSRAIIILCAVGASAAVVVLMMNPWRAPSVGEPEPQAISQPMAEDPVDAISPLPQLAHEPVTDEPPVVSAEGETQSPARDELDEPSSADSVQLFEQGMAAVGQGRLIQARALLSRAYFSGGLNDTHESQAVEKLQQLFNETIMSRRILDGDEYVHPYTPMPGDTLAGSRGIVERQKLYVPANFVVIVNKMGSGQNMQAGRTIKLVKGPFHARVNKNRLVMDVYLQPEGLEPVFAMRFPVALGRGNSTPLGRWRLVAGGKTERKPWTPTENSDLPPVPIAWGSPDYALGFKGMWIGLAGMDVHNDYITDFGIHSTNKPESIGSYTSLGCVRMGDEGIEMVFNMLYDGRSVFSTVEVVE